MYKFGKFVEIERENYRQVHSENKDQEESKLLYFKRLLRER